MARAKWKTVKIRWVGDNGDVSLHTSEAKAYEVVNATRSAYSNGDHSVLGVNVFEWDRSADRWQPFDTHDFAKGE